MSISFYRITNDRNIGNCSPRKEDYDLLQLVVIRLGEENYRSEGQDVREFLSTIFYPHGQGFRKKIAKYIDLEHCLHMEVDGMSGLGESIFLEGREKGIELGIERGIAQGIERGIAQGIERGIAQGIEQGIERGIELFILDNLEEGVSETRIIEKLQRRFHLKEEDAKAYFEKFAFVG